MLSIHVCVGVLTHVDGCEGKRLMFSSVASLPYILRQSLSPNLEVPILARLTGQLVLRIFHPAA